MRNHTSCLLPSESFLGKDREKKKVCTSSSGEGESGCQWTDSATDHDTSSIDNVVEGSANNRMCSRRHPMHLTTKKREMQRRGIGMGISLTDEALADHDRSAHLSCQACPIGYGLVFPDCRPFVPRLQLEDAGLSYGPPNSICPSYTTLNSLTPSELEQLADLPVDYQHLMSRRAKLVSEGTEKENNQKSRRDSGKIKATKEKRNKKAQVADIPPLPSYSNVSHCIHKTTACFEVGKQTPSHTPSLKFHPEPLGKKESIERTSRVQSKDAGA